jgi:hypothetical protein
MVLNIGNRENEEDTDEDHDIFDAALENVIDSDMSDIVQGPVMSNPRLTNLFSTQRGWRVLRLPGGRAGEEGSTGLRGFSNFMLQIIPGWRGQTIRDSPFRQMVTARMWQSYINNMEAIDDALEIQAAYSPEELISLRAFCEEWVIDPGHIGFTRRLSNHPSTHASDAILKGNMIYDLCTGQIQLRTSRGERGDANIPIRLAHDILTSIPFTEYNYYTLNSVHAQEGAQVYSGFLNRYVKLTATEVATVEEIEGGIRAGGRGYATMSTNITGDPIEALSLMQQTVEAHDIGDTLTVRANLNALLSPPYNFRSGAQQVNVSGPHGGRFVAMDQIRVHRFQEGSFGANGAFANTVPYHMMYRQGRNNAGEVVMWPEIQMTSIANTQPPHGYYMEVSADGLGVEHVWEVFSVGNNKHIRLANADDQAMAISGLIGGFNRVDAEARDGRAPDGAPGRDAADARRGIRGGPRGNPRDDMCPGTTAIDPYTGVYYACSKPEYHGGSHDFSIKRIHANSADYTGENLFDNSRKNSSNPGVRENRWGSPTTMARGKYIYVELLHKTQIEFKGKHKTTGKQGGKQFWLQGSLGLSDPTGLGRLLPGGVGKGYFFKKAIETRTQTAQPWLVAIPRADFQPFTDSKGRRTIRPKRRKAELDPAWEKFLKFYGVPTYEGGSAGKANLHIIRQADQGKFYDKLRSKPTVKE